MVRSRFDLVRMVPRSTGVLLVLGAGACASSPPPAPPPPAPVDEPKPVAPAPESSTAAVAETPSDAGVSETDASVPVPSPAEPSEMKRSQKPVEMLTARDAAFLIDYANSGAKQTAQTACEKEAKDDAEKRAACLTKAREKFSADVLRFRRDSETQVSLLVYKRNASTLLEVWVGVVELSEPSSDSVKVKLTGRQKGTRPLWRGRSEVVINVPNDYSIEFDDPEHGRLRYDAKIGLVTQ
jgi:hypothetical protein